MKLKTPKNLVGKIASLLLAIAIWFLIKHHINNGGGEGAPRNVEPQRGIVVPES